MTTQNSLEEGPEDANASPHLLRRFGLLQSTALNMTNMIGIGPFITIPLLMSALGGPQAMLGWVVALAIAIPDGLIWGELGAAMPGSGGTYVYLREAFGRQTFGRLMAFLFIWQFIISGPLEIASGYIGFANYLGYLWKGITPFQTNVVITVLGLLAIALLYRRITSIGKLTISLWIGTLLTVLAVIVAGALHFNARRAFDFPPGPFHFSLGFLFGLGAAARLGVYDYLGYYDICYIGDEVKEPARVIPRSIIISIIAVAAIYFAINLSIVGVIPWREFVPADSHHEIADFIGSIFMERVYGPTIAKIVTVMILWTAFGSVFALLLGYSRIPYAAAVDGNFFPIFARLHPTKNFPYISLIVMGLLSIVCGFLPLGAVIDALMITRILVQFIGQVFAIFLLRKRLPGSALPYKMWLYPLPCLLALVGWIFLFATAEKRLILLGMGTLALGVICFLIWTKIARLWPFGQAYQVAAVNAGHPEISSTENQTSEDQTKAEVD
jgi:amino acid transporter